MRSHLRTVAAGLCVCAVSDLAWTAPYMRTPLVAPSFPHSFATSDAFPPAFPSATNLCVRRCGGGGGGRLIINFDPGMCTIPSLYPRWRTRLHFACCEGLPPSQCRLQGVNSRSLSAQMVDALGSLLCLFAISHVFACRTCLHVACCTWLPLRSATRRAYGRSPSIPAYPFALVLVRKAAMHVHVASVGFGLVEKLHTWRLVA